MDGVERFAEIVSPVVGSVRLDLAVAEIARGGRPEVDATELLGRLDELAAGVSEPTLEATIDHLFVECGFRGDADNYFDPANSFLDVVLDRRLGNPITLSVLLSEVGRRKGLPIEGVSMPAHFVARHVRSDGEIVYIDAFDGGVRYDESGVRDLFERRTGGRGQFAPAYLEPALPIVVVIRILNNLKEIYRSVGDRSQLLWVQQYRAMVRELGPNERREYAKMLATIGRIDVAARELQSLGESPDEGGTEDDLNQAAQLWARLN